MNKQYRIEIKSEGDNHWWRIRRLGNYKKSVTSEMYTRRRDARRAAEDYAKSILKAPNMEIVGDLRKAGV